jgi:hypothetical protein
LRPSKDNDVQEELDTHLHSPPISLDTVSGKIGTMFATFHFV